MSEPSEKEKLDEGRIKAARVAKFVTHVATAVNEVIVGSAELGAFNSKKPKKAQEKNAEDVPAAKS